MKKVFILFFLVIVSIGLQANQNNDLVIAPSTYNSLNMIDDSPYVGPVFDENGKYEGRYVRPIFKITGDVKKYYKYILFSALQQKLFSLSDEAEENKKIILGRREDVLKVVDTAKIITYLVDKMNNLYEGNMKKIIRDFVDNMFFIIQEDLKCKDPQFQKTSYQQGMCNVLNSRWTEYFRSSAIVIMDSFWDKAVEHISKKTFAEISVKLIGKACFAIDAGLSLVESTANITSAWSIVNDVTNKYYMSMMLSDFYMAYAYFDQDIYKLRDFIAEKAKKYNYGIHIMGAPTITKEYLRTFLHVFYHYIQLRKTTDFGYYNFRLKKENKNYAHALEEVNMKVAPAASAIMLDLIERYGNGGNFRTTISPSYKRDFTYSLVSPNNNKIEGLYNIPEAKNVSTYKNGETYTFLNIDGMGPSERVNGKCEINEVPIEYDRPTLSINGNEPLVSNSMLYHVKINGKTSQKYLHELNYKITCKYKYESQVWKIDTTWKQEREIRKIFVPEVLADIRGSWAKKYIKSFYTSGFIRGYDDGYFHPDRNISNGEFLAVATNSILTNDLEWKDKIKNVKDDNNVPSSKYVKILKQYGVNVEPLNGVDIYSVLNVPASRGYVSKVLSNLLMVRNDRELSKLNLLDKDKIGKDQFVNCAKGSYDGDWDECSNYLREHCISQGSETSRGSGTYQYKPQQNSRRDEALVLIYNSREVAIGKSLCDMKGVKNENK